MDADQRCLIYRHGARTGDGVALTFDDGPNPPITEQVLAVLAAHSARATFFVMGKWVERYPETLRRIVAAGHPRAGPRGRGARGGRGWGGPGPPRAGARGGARPGRARRPGEGAARRRQVAGSTGGRPAPARRAPARGRRRPDRPPARHKRP